MAQVKWAPVGFEAEDPGEHPPIGRARLTLSLRQGLASADPCEPCSDEIELDARVGNYLFRVEIHDVAHDAAGAPERVVLKWSRENGAEAARLGDEPPGFVAGDWIYEFYDGEPARAASECHLGYHHPDVLAAWSPRRGTLVEGYPGSPPVGFALVRRWGAQSRRREAPRPEARDRGGKAGRRARGHHARHRGEARANSGSHGR